MARRHPRAVRRHGARGREHGREDQAGGGVLQARNYGLTASALIRFRLRAFKPEHAALASRSRTPNSASWPGLSVAHFQ